MKNPFVTRAPWLMAIFSLIFGVFPTLLLLNRARLAGLALIAVVAGILAGSGFLPLVVADGINQDTYWMVSVPLALAGLVLVVIVALRRNHEEPLRWYASWRFFVALNLAQFGLAFAIRTWLYQPFYMPSASMLPTIAVNDNFFAEKFAYRSSDPARGDIVLFRRPDGTIWVKRVVGIPGDRIQMVRDILVINGKPVARTRLADYPVADLTFRSRQAAQYRVTLPDGRSFREIGGAPDSIYSNTDAVTVPKGTVFVIGDNLDNSEDSRGQVGFVLRETIVGRAGMRFVSRGHLAWERIE